MAAYKQSLEARAAYKRIRSTLANPPRERMPLPVPKGDLAAEDVSFSLQENPVLHNISFSLKAGAALAVIGPSASGKSTL